jgi:hypothetical protein
MRIKQAITYNIVGFPLILFKKRPGIIDYRYNSGVLVRLFRVEAFAQLDYLSVDIYGIDFAVSIAQRSLNIVSCSGSNYESTITSIVYLKRNIIGISKKS